MSEDCCEVVVTAADADWLAEFTSRLVADRLAACGHVIPEIRSIYRWEGAVQDEGEGIPPEHLARLTERFYRVDKARSRHTGGSGLGLAIVKHALSHHDAQLEIESQVGVGSRFSFLIPARMVVK